MSKYMYQVVSGAAIFGRPRRSLWAARAVAEGLAVTSAVADTFEIERFQENPLTGARRYWRLTGKRWTNDFATEVSVRKPAWSVTRKR